MLSETFIGLPARAEWVAYAGEGDTWRQAYQAKMKSANLKKPTLDVVRPTALEERLSSRTRDWTGKSPLLDNGAECACANRTGSAAVSALAAA